ncbi:hypothetical protein UCRPA7_4973 [Phaeoacremonium minimum UCRPA7]|uniref:Uncharacterized protein n=1 Tax=Phaeoacremonium minimum (strain UCR-PA7) TaxID=1286976 RepID=R8BJH1_PHAM7|nr:hypothetical protein UCRPA7_4973 [Phaeoacremonium minimum UCRPA7]EON99493.1 hypothetical protein UCRPA7_4973 [Phaeoacremonium minimum UCRPA7]
MRPTKATSATGTTHNTTTPSVGNPILPAANSELATVGIGIQALFNVWRTGADFDTQSACKFLNQPRPMNSKPSREAIEDRPGAARIAADHLASLNQRQGPIDTMSKRMAN